jgi:hypothetical protein
MAAVKRFMLVQRLHVLDIARVQLAASSTAQPSCVTSSDLSFVLLAAQQSARAAAKASLRGHLDGAGLAVADSVIRATVAQVNALSADHHSGTSAAVVSSTPLPPPLALTPSDALIEDGSIGTKWRGWELIAALCARDTEPFAGGATAAQPDLTLSLAFPRGLPPPLSAAWDIMQVAAAVASVVASCARLELQAVGLEAGFCSPQRLMAVALVERLLHEILPLPAPPSSPEGSAWNLRPAPPTFTGDAQTAFLASLGSLLRHYLAALHSTPASEGGGSVALITQCAIVTVLDAAVRVTASDGPLPLTRVLTGCAGAAGAASSAGRVHGIPIPLAFLGSVTSIRLLASPAVRRTRAAISAYVTTLNATAAAVPLIESGMASFSRSFRGSWPSYEGISMLTSAPNVCTGWKGDHHTSMYALVRCVAPLAHSFILHSVAGGEGALVHARLLAHEAACSCCFSRAWSCQCCGGVFSSARGIRVAAGQRRYAGPLGGSHATWAIHGSQDGGKGEKAVGRLGRTCSLHSLLLSRRIKVHLTTCPCTPARSSRRF